MRFLVGVKPNPGPQETVNIKQVVSCRLNL